MILRDWFRPPRHLLALFVAATVVPALALGWLAWWSLGQDAALDRQRVQDTLETAFGKVVSDLQLRLDDVSRQLSSLARASDVSLPDDSVLLLVGDDRVADRPSGRLLYYPRTPGTPPARNAAQDVALDAATVLEVRAQNPTAAAEAFRRIANSGMPAVQAPALLGLARCLRQTGRPQEALLAYDRLAQFGTLDVEGAPAALVARRARCAVLAALKAPELQSAARDLYQDLLRRRWILDRATFEYYASEARAWLPADAAPQPNPALLALADAASDIYALRRQRNASPGRGSATLWRQGRPLLIVWQNTPEEMTALVAGASWFERPAATWAADNLAVALTSADSHVTFGEPDRLSKPVVVGSMADTGLPWTVRIASADPAKVPSLLARSRRLVVSGLAVVGLLIVSGGFLVARALGRELAVARLQSDFVAAVSHEFRSPLTSMKHLIEMLDQGAVSSEERRQQYYHVLNGEADRLHQMVENLLNFGRMEAGKAEYRFERLDARALVEQVATDFGGQLISRDRLIVDVQGGPVRVNADREALSRALRNLLDNAAKYSAPTAPIRLAIDANAKTASIHVRNEGPGIPADERKMIFTKFYRGAGAKQSGVKGTGLGLATVQYIVRAHHGDVLLDSSPGQGSTFTIALPIAKEEMS
jgi:signal transduction histidine kinase